MTSPLSSGRSRPMAYSESHMHIPRIQSNLAPLLISDIPPIAPSHRRGSPGAPPIVTPPRQWIPFVHWWALRFTFHLTLISLFETLFFWHFISASEDNALVSLVQTYTQDVLNNCANLTSQQRVIIREVVDLFINQTTADEIGATALTRRGAFNDTLFRNSWLYFGGLLFLFTALAAAGHSKRYKTEWRALITENITLVTLLGLYEWMFFSTVILRYQAISMPELDRMVIDEFQMQC